MTFDPSVTAFIHPGQGSQFIGMGKSLAEHFSSARQVFMEADGILGFGLSELMWNGPESELNDTVNTQPALFVHSMAAYRVIKELFPDFSPRMMAGHSLGELSAVSAAGALSFPDGLRLVLTRGKLMKRAGEVNPGGMAAILGLDIPTLEKVCAEASSETEVVQVANDNCPGQVVISGHRPALERAIASAKAAGAKRALQLAVSIAAHSPLMDTIQSEWTEVVNSTPFKNPEIPVMGNVTAEALMDVRQVRDDLIAQMQSRVRWTESVRLMASLGITNYYELGAGSVLGGLVKRISEGAVTCSLGNAGDFENLSMQA